jgi:hypothetical protein
MCSLLMRPDVLREFKNRFNLSWNADQTQLSFNQDSFYVFDPELSNGACADSPYWRSFC